MRKLKEYHLFIDESGDTTFFGKKGRIIIGNEGVSKSFILGMVQFNTNINIIRNNVISMQKEIENDPLLQDISKIKNKKAKDGYFFHAKDDISELKNKFIRFIKTLDCSFEAIVARKIPDMFEKKHKSNEAHLYADLLSELLKNKIRKNKKLVLNIASRGKCTRNANIELALKTIKKTYGKKVNFEFQTNIKFNITNQIQEPLLNVADYFCWTIQRVFEKGDTKYYNFLKEKIKLIVDIYDWKEFQKTSPKNYYGEHNPLTKKNMLSPSLH